MSEARRNEPTPATRSAIDSDSPRSTARRPRLRRQLRLDPRVALLTVLVDLMANSATIVSAGLLYEVELGARSY